MAKLGFEEELETAKISSVLLRACPQLLFSVNSFNANKSLDDVSFCVFPLLFAADHVFLHANAGSLY